MPVHVKIGGVWKLCDDIHVKVAGIWKTLGQASVKVGGTWYETLADLIVVSMVGGTHATSRVGGACSAYIEFNSDGTEYWSTNLGAMTIDKGPWLDAGGASSVYAERTIDSGSLDRDDLGTSRLALGATRGMGVQRTFGEGNGTDTCTFTVRMYDAASGGNLLQSIQYTTTATKTGL